MRNLRRVLENMGNAVLELVWAKQVRCQGCGDLSGADEAYLCGVCAHRLEELRPPESQRCLGCGNPVEARCICKRMPHVAFSRFAFYYQGPVRGIVRNLKYHAVTCMADWMAAAMYEILLREDWLEDVHALVPVPMPPKRMKTRGYNQAQLLANALAGQTAKSGPRKPGARRRGQFAFTPGRGAHWGSPRRRSPPPVHPPGL